MFRSFSFREVTFSKLMLLTKYSFCFSDQIGGEWLWFAFPCGCVVVLLIVFRDQLSIQ